jgi:hypothetical protein
MRHCKASDGKSRGAGLLSGASKRISQPAEQFSPQQKLAILREHLVEHVPVSDLCETKTKTLRNPQNFSYEVSYLRESCQLNWMLARKPVPP